MHLEGSDRGYFCGNILTIPGGCVEATEPLS